MSDAVWYYARAGRQEGPVTFEALRAMAASGVLQSQDLVWTNGMAEWQPAAVVAGLFAHDAAAAAPHTPDYAPHYTAQTTGGAQLGCYTPESLEITYAGFWIRFGAYIIDWIVTFVTGFCVGGVIGFFIGLGGAAGGGADSGIGLVLNLMGVVLGWLYEALMTSSTKQATLGKMAVGLVVIGEDGGRISFARATGRFFARYVNILTLMIGYMMAGWTERKRGLHDMIAGTYVVFGRRGT